MPCLKSSSSTWPIASLNCPRALEVDSIDLAAVVVLKLKDAGTARITIKDAFDPVDTHVLLKQLKVRGLARFFSPHFYRTKLARRFRPMARAKGK